MSRKTTAAPTLETFENTRPWALSFAVLFFLYGAVGGIVGVIWLVGLINGFISGPPPTKPFITAESVNLLFAPIALVGGTLALSYHHAAGHACWRKSFDDLERASTALKRLWVWASAAITVLFVFCVCMVIAAILTGEWPG